VSDESIVSDKSRLPDESRSPDESWQAYSNTLQKLLLRPDLLNRFREDIDGTKTAELHISSDMRSDLKNLILRFPSLREEEASTTPSSADEDRLEESMLEAGRFFERSFLQLRRGALTTTVMSILIFLMGLVLLGVGAAQSIRGSEPGTAVVLAASGIVAIAAAFYRSPVTQIRESAAEVQRSSMILMSYMLGLSLLSKSLRGMETAKESEMLTGLTRDLVALLPGDARVAKAGRRDGQSGSTPSSGP
jgi:hypothetical protein